MNETPCAGRENPALMQQLSELPRAKDLSPTSQQAILPGKK